MSYVCPECSNRNLSSALRIELAGDSRSDEIAVQIIACPSCNFAGVAVYEESRRGAIDSESWEHTGYRIEKAEWLRLTGMILKCPQPSNRHCACPSHRSLGQKSRSGRWLGAPGAKEPFPMRQ